LWFTQVGADSDDGALTKTGNTRTSLVWHKRAIGYHSQQGPTTEVARNVPIQSTDLVSKMSCGAVKIDDDGVYKLLHDETATPA
jgi:hypothetical protein